MILPRCRDVAARAARGESLGLGGRLHLLYCSFCRRFVRQLALIESALREAVFPKADSAALERRLLERFRKA